MPTSCGEMLGGFLEAQRVASRRISAPDGAVHPPAGEPRRQLNSEVADLSRSAAKHARRHQDQLTSRSDWRRLLSGSTARGTRPSNDANVTVWKRSVRRVRCSALALLKLSRSSIVAVVRHDFGTAMRPDWAGG